MDTKELKTKKENSEKELSDLISKHVKKFQEETGIEIINVFHYFKYDYNGKDRSISKIETTILLDI